jgi:hypothetical protein
MKYSAAEIAFYSLASKEAIDSLAFKRARGLNSSAEEAAVDAEMRSLRRRIEDRLRKDVNFLGKCALHFREECIPVEEEMLHEIKMAASALKKAEKAEEAAVVEVRRLASLLMDAGIPFRGEHPASIKAGLASRLPVKEVGLKRDILE